MGTISAIHSRNAARRLYRVVSYVLTTADTTKLFAMYALIENQKVIGVFEETENVTLTDGQTVVPIDENCFFWLIGGDAVFGVLTKVDEWQIETNENSYELSEVDSWQPIGEWRPF